jgi:hypothetical protein
VYEREGCKWEVRCTSSTELRTTGQQSLDTGSGEVGAQGG